MMFPDVYSDCPGSAVNLVLPEDIAPEAQAQLQLLLDIHTALKIAKQLPPEDQLGLIGKTLTNSAQFVCKGMEVGAQKACELIEYVGEKQKEKIAAAEQDTKVGPVLEYSAKGAKYATKATVLVSGYMADRVGRITVGLSNYLASKVEKPVTGAVVGATGGATMTKRSSTMYNFIDAARGGLIAFGTVYSGLEDSAKVLGGCAKEKSVDVVQHKYGREAGKVYGDSMTAAGNAAVTYMNVSSVGIKGIAKKTAKRTAKEVGKNVLEAHIDRGEK